MHLEVILSSDLRERHEGVERDSLRASWTKRICRTTVLYTNDGTANAVRTTTTIGSWNASGSVPGRETPASTALKYANPQLDICVLGIPKINLSLAPVVHPESKHGTLVRRGCLFLVKCNPR